MKNSIPRAQSPVLWVAAVLSAGTLATQAVIVLPAYVPGASSPDTFSSASPQQMVNNSGLSAPVNTGDTLAHALSVTHSYNGGFTESWVTNGVSPDYFGSTRPAPVLVFDLGRDMTLRDILLWQYQNNGGPGLNDQGNHARSIDVRINTAAEGFAAFSGPVTPLTMLPVQDADGIPGNDLGGTNSAQAFGLGGATGRYVQLTVTDNYRNVQGITGGGDRVGLGEIRFNVPDGGSTGMLATLALLGLAPLKRWLARRG